MPRNGTTALRKISIQGLRSFVEPVSYEFPRSGLLLVSGTNKDTGGSSGSGKSSFLLAIASALGIAPFSAVDLVSWQAPKGGAHSLEFDTDKGLVVIQRGKKTTLTVAGTPFKGSSAQIEEELQRIIGLKPEMLAMLTYRGQKKPGLFMSKSDAQKKEFLMQLLGLDKFELALEDGKTKVSVLEGKTTAVRTGVDRLRSDVEGYVGLASLEVAKELLVTSEADLAQARVLKSELKANIDAFRKTRAFEEKEAAASFAPALQAAREELAGVTLTEIGDDETEIERLLVLAAGAKDRIEKLLDADATKRQQLDSWKAQQNRIIQGLKAKAGAKAGLVAETDRLRVDFAVLEQELCSTCNRPWDKASSQLKAIERQIIDVEAKLTAIYDIEVEIKRLSDALAAAPAFVPNPMIAKLEPVHAQLRDQVAAERQRLTSLKSVARAEYTAKKAQLQSAVTELEKKQLQAVRDAQQVTLQILNPITAEFHGIDTEELALNVSACRQEVTRLESQYKARDGAIALLAKFQAELNESTASLSAEKDFLAMIGREGFLGAIFDEVLAEISDETNKILGAVANTRHCTLRFASESVTQKGSVQKKIVPVITVGDFEAPFEAGLSGGMQSAVELAVDLAVGAVISRREGACPGWLILDECFEGLDSVSKEACFEILSEYAHDRLVLVVDHSSEFKGLIPHRVNIEFSNGISRIV